MVCLQLLQGAGHNVSAIFVDYGQLAATQEIMAARQIARYFDASLKEVRISLNKTFGAGEVKYRNGSLIFVGAMAAAPDTDNLVIGIHAGTPYPDCSDNFVSSVSELLSKSTERSCALIAPIRSWLKSQIVAYAVKENLPIRLTYSCESGGRSPCGACDSCKDRISAAC